MDYVYIGKIVNTHGIKGELRIRSNFELKNVIFKPGFTLYVGEGYVHNPYYLLLFFFPYPP